MTDERALRRKLAALVKRCGGAPLRIILMINLAIKPQKLTEIRMHCYPEAAAFAMNRSKSPRQHVWVPVMWGGPFDDVERALFVYHLWEHKTRGPAPRIVQGIYLTRIYGRALGFSMHVIPFSRDAVLERESDKLAERATRVARRRGRRGGGQAAGAAEGHAAEGTAEEGTAEEESDEDALAADDPTSAPEKFKLAQFYRRYSAVFT